MHNFDQPGRFVVHPIEVDRDRHVIYHAIGWVPEYDTGTRVVGHLVTDRDTAAALVQRLNAPTRYEALEPDPLGDAVKAITIAELSG